MIKKTALKKKNSFYFSTTKIKIMITDADDGNGDTLPRKVFDENEGNHKKEPSHQRHPKPPPPFVCEAGTEDIPHFLLPVRKSVIRFPTLHDNNTQKWQGQQNRDECNDCLLPWWIKSCNTCVVPPHKATRHLNCVCVSKKKED